MGQGHASDVRDARVIGSPRRRKAVVKCSQMGVAGRNKPRHTCITVTRRQLCMVARWTGNVVSRYRLGQLPVISHGTASALLACVYLGPTPLVTEHDRMIGRGRVKDRGYQSAVGHGWLRHYRKIPPGNLARPGPSSLLVQHGSKNRKGPVPTGRCRTLPNTPGDLQAG